MGNEKVHLLTTSGQYMLRMEMMSTTIGWVSAEYRSYFCLDDESRFYMLHVGGYSGDCGESPMRLHNRLNFTTKDCDNDVWDGVNCANLSFSGWWFNTCVWVSLNGRWGYNFALWSLADSDVFLTASRMMIKLIQ